ncbi:hypothetical protein WA171_005065 [Blastocystis sp. BT1]
MGERKSVIHRALISLLDIIIFEAICLVLIESVVIYIYQDYSRDSLLDISKKIAICYCVIRLIFAIVSIVLFITSFYVPKDLLIALLAINCGSVYALWKPSYSSWIYSTINSSLGPFYAKVSRKAFLYFRRRMVNALNLCSYLVLIYLVWSIGIYSIQIMMKMVKDEMSLHSFERVNRNPSHSAEKLKVD